MPFGLRPIYDHQEQRVNGHLFITLIAYHLVQTLRSQLKANGIHDRWQTLRTKMENQQRVTVLCKRNDGKTIHLRKATRAEPHQLEIYHALGISLPESQKILGVPEIEVITAANADRETDPARKKWWRDFYQRLTDTAWLFALLSATYADPNVYKAALCIFYLNIISEEGQAKTAADLYARSPFIAGSNRRGYAARSDRKVVAAVASMGRAILLPLRFAARFAAQKIELSRSLDAFTTNSEVQTVAQPDDSAEQARAGRIVGDSVHERLVDFEPVDR